MQITFEGTPTEFGELTEVVTKLDLLIERGNQIMATVQEVKDAVAAEKAEVKAKLDGLTAEIVALKAQVTAGNAVTPQQLDELIVAVKDIFTPDGTVNPGTVNPI